MRHVPIRTSTLTLDRSVPPTRRTGRPCDVVVDEHTGEVARQHVHEDREDREPDFGRPVSIGGYSVRSDAIYPHQDYAHHEGDLLKRHRNRDVLVVNGLPRVPLAILDTDPLAAYNNQTPPKIEPKKSPQPHSNNPLCDPFTVVTRSWEKVMVSVSTPVASVSKALAISVAMSNCSSDLPESRPASRLSLARPSRHAVRIRLHFFCPGQHHGGRGQRERRVISKISGSMMLVPRVVALSATP